VETEVKYIKYTMEDIACDGILCDFIGAMLVLFGTLGVIAVA
jgi:hypothetical protein